MSNTEWLTFCKALRKAADERELSPQANDLTLMEVYSEGMKAILDPKGFRQFSRASFEKKRGMFGSRCVYNFYDFAKQFRRRRRRQLKASKK